MTEREEALTYQIKELIGVIEEYRAMPCDSLERRMFAQSDRATLALNRINPEGGFEKYRTPPQFPDGTPIPEDHHSHPGKDTK